jgi:hypothetical protein
LRLAEIDSPVEKSAAYFSDLADDKAAIRYRAAATAAMLTNSAPAEGGIDLLLAFKRHGEASGSLRTLRSIAATAAAQAATVVVEAARRRPQDAKDLLFLVAAGTGFADSSGEAVLALRQRWPKHYGGLFWRAVIASHDLKPSAYLAELEKVVRGKGHTSFEIIRTLARRADYEECFAPRMPAAIDRLVRSEMKKFRSRRGKVA